MCGFAVTFTQRVADMLRNILTPVLYCTRFPPVHPFIVYKPCRHSLSDEQKIELLRLTTFNSFKMPNSIPARRLQESNSASQAPTNPIDDCQNLIHEYYAGDADEDDPILIPTDHPVLIIGNRENPVALVGQSTGYQGGRMMAFWNVERRRQLERLAQKGLDAYLEFAETRNGQSGRFGIILMFVQCNPLKLLFVLFLSLKLDTQDRVSQLAGTTTSTVEDISVSYFQVENDENEGLISCKSENVLDRTQGKEKMEYAVPDTMTNGHSHHS